jgi:hypothetical protein
MRAFVKCVFPPRANRSRRSAPNPGNAASHKRVSSRPGWDASKGPPRGAGCAPARPGSARCAAERVWTMPCCKLLPTVSSTRGPASSGGSRAAAGSCRGNPANLGAAAPHRRTHSPGNPAPPPRAWRGPDSRDEPSRSCLPAGQREPAPAARRSPIQAHYSQTGPSPDHRAERRGRLSRPGARYPDCSWPVSPGRSPNPAYLSPGTGLSTVPAVRRGWGPRDWGSCRPGSGTG